MNAVEIEIFITELASQPFNASEFPFAFLAAFGNKDTTLKRLRTGNNNASDVAGGVLLRNNIHIGVCEEGAVGDMLKALRASPATTKAKAKFILATDGQTLEAEDLVSGDSIAPAFSDFSNHFGFFLPLAGISTVKEIKDNPIDVRATGRLNKLYVELLRENPEWAKNERRTDMNHFMARIIFCFFAEDTDIFNGQGLFTRTVEQISERDGSNTHEVLEHIFRAMNLKTAERASAKPRLPIWANGFPYVNGGLFSGNIEVPRFTRMARTYLMHAGGLNWREINPDIFGSMIQAVADDEERGALGMHYTSVPNILKVLNPLFLDDLRAQLIEAGDNERKLLNLRKRIARIRVFDPACGSGNFLVIAYKQMREIEAEVNRLRGENYLGSEIPLTNFRGIELRDFPAEIARLALIIAEFQCDVLYRGQKDAVAEFLPLDTQNWIVCGNALRLDWLNICPPTGTGVKLVADDLFETPLNQSEIYFENEGGETYICGNPPYLGKGKLSAEQKSEMHAIFNQRIPKYGYIDFVASWFIKASDYLVSGKGIAAFVATSSICQGRQSPLIWEEIEKAGMIKCFAYSSFKWSNNAANKAAVICVIVGIAKKDFKKDIYLYSENEKKRVAGISAYLTEGEAPYIKTQSSPLSKQLEDMQLGNKANDGGFLSFSRAERDELLGANASATKLIKRYYGSREFNNSLERYCLWISDAERQFAVSIPAINDRIENTRKVRLISPDAGNSRLAEKPYQFREMHCSRSHTIIVPIMTSVRREYLPCGLLNETAIISGQAFGIYDGQISQLAILLSRLHLVWIAAICGRFKEDYRYSNDLGWNTFPVPLLTEQNKADLQSCAENILIARETHFPATIAELYDPDNMPENLRRAHEQNDEVLERIYVGRRFKNDTERLEKLFELYRKIIAATDKSRPVTKAKRKIKS